VTEFADFSGHKKPDKEGLLKFSLTVFIVTVFHESMGPPKKKKGQKGQSKVQNRSADAFADEKKSKK
jgi:hypothetical protein